ncbi:MAG: 2-oxo acid dehydrogenase subunit E2, partial [Phycisphaerae bacterium]|nr:2-oxo acid dehydrogenase subunit E2 [Phycisphaerae bacterium]
IEKGTPILEVETDKATQEVEAPTAGVLAKIIKEVGEEVPCNHVVAVITEPGEPVPTAIPVEIAEGVAPTSEIQVAAGGVSSQRQQKEQQDTSQKRISISPSARKLAKELGVDISKIVTRGSRIKREDVDAAFQAMQSGATAGPGLPAARKPMSSMRRKIAEHMNKSARTVARVGLTLEVNATNLVAERENMLVDGTKVSYNVLLARHVATALEEFPYMNAQINGDEIWEFEDANIGIAVDTERGLMVPVLQAANRKNIEELQRELLSLADRAVKGKISVTDLEGGTFTITNLGTLDIESFLPVLNVPECAILGVGAIIEKPIVENGVVTIRPQMKMTLAFDHRLVDGGPAARFFQRLKDLVEEMPV